MPPALIQPLVALLALAGSLAVAAGVWLLLRPEAAERLTREHSLYQLLRWANQPYRVERFIYRHNRLFGAAVMGGALAVLALLWQPSPPNLLQAVFLHDFPGHGELVLALQSTMLTLTVGALFALAVGALILVRPSLLRGFEAWANQPVTLREILERLHRARLALARAIGRHPRATALLLIGGGGYLLATILIYLSSFTDKG